MQRSNLAAAVGRQRPIEVGLILLDASLTPIYISSTARQIICCAEGQKTMRDNRIQEAIRSKVISDPRRQTHSAKTLVSGRRLYRCREFLLEHALTPTPHRAIVLERISGDEQTRKPALEQIKLTPQERELVSLLVAGKTSEQIVRRMSISSRTLRTYSRSIIKKLKKQR
jgi:DNA-binding CsgD family transcriptional regulator